MKSLATSILLTVIIIYCGLIVFALIFANGMIFQPPLPTYQQHDRLIMIDTSDGASIAATHLSNEKSTYTILYSHGNAIDLGGLYPILDEIRGMGFSVFAYDYRGYGLGSGSASEENTYRDIYAAYRYLRDDLNIPAEKIIALGQSLGGAVAADLANREPLGGLILESSFVTAYRVLTRIPLLPFDQFETHKKLGGIDCPVLVIHGKEDRVIPFWHGRKLFEEANEPKQHYWVESAGHNNLLQVAGKQYEQALNRFTELMDEH